MNTISYGQFTRTTLTQTAQRINSNLSSISKKILELQTQMATGKSLNRPSDDPFRTVVALQLQTILENKAQYKENVQHAKDMLSATDQALGDMGDILVEARSLGLGEIGTTASKETREAAALVVDSLIDEFVGRANTQSMGRYLFGGTSSETYPFQSVGTAIAFVGNNESLRTSADEISDVECNVTSNKVLATESGRITGFSDLNPTIDADTELRLLNAGSGVCLGGIIVCDGTNTNTIDLRHAKTVGDVIDAINNATPATTVCTYDAAQGGLVIQSSVPGADITVVEASNGTTARDLGIRREAAGGGSLLAGTDLNPRLDLATKIGLLNMAAGFDTSSGIRITNGDFDATVTFDDCETIEDVLNAINGSGVYVRASIAGDGKRLQVVSLLHGPEMRIGEVGGSTATDLGIRSLNAGTALSDLRDKRGVRTIEGDDLRITCRSSDVIGVDISGCATIADVIDAINNDADNGGRLVAALAGNGNGITVTDLTVDAGVSFSVRSVAGSYAAEDLGIDKTAAAGGDVIVGDDNNGIRNQSAVTHLMDLREALYDSDDAAITRALERLEVDYTQILNGRGEAGIKGQRMEVLKQRIDQEVLDATAFLSRTQDIDFASAAVEYATLQAAMQACLQTAAAIVQMSLLDYLD